jgi:hypothetical protein
MGRCENCGNEYDKSFQITIQGQAHEFDSFECAINSVAPRCSHCNTAIIGHGVESSGKMFCCAQCAREQGHDGVIDHA